MKKLAKILLVLLIAVVASVSFTACGNTTSTVNNTKGLHFKLSSGSYIVTGYTLEDDFDGKLTIPSTYKDKAVTEIKASAFSENENITEIIVPSSVTKIGEGAFSKMTKLAKVDLPFVGESADAVNANRVFGYLFAKETFVGSVSVSQSYSKSETATTYYIPKTLSEIKITASEEYKLPDYAFDGFKTIDSVVLNANVTEIGYKAFSNCAILKTLDLTNVKKIGGYAFSGCEKLTTVTVGALETIGEYAFSGLNLTTFTIPNTVTYVGEFAFSEMKKLESVTVGTGVKELRSYTFYKCTALKTMNVESVEIFGTGAFYNCSALTLAKLSSAKYVKNGAFSRCTSLDYDNIIAPDSCVFEEWFGDFE